MKRLALLAVLASFAGAAAAASTTYVIDPTHTLPRFSYSHFGYSTQLSRFDKTSGTITIDPAAGTGHVDVVIDATSVDSGYPVFNGHLQDADFFDTAKYPTITFKSDKVAFKDGKVVSVSGDLTIKGVTRPVTLDVTSFLCMKHPIMNKPACGANATAVIKRSEFNMGKYAPYVSDDVRLDIPVEAIAQQ